jgi:hypothetical protein
MPIYAGAAGVSGFVRLELRVYDLDGALADPDDISVTVIAPDGTSTNQTGSIEHPLPGIYHLDYEPSQVGHYGVYWVTTGVNAGTLEEGFNVDDLTVSPPIALADVKRHLNMTATDYADDDELRFFILAATDLVEGEVGPLARRSVSETHNGGRASVILRQAPVIQVTDVMENGNPVSSYAVEIDTGILTKTSGYSASVWTEGFNNIEVDYIAGRTSIPAGLQQAILETVRHLWQTQRGTIQRRGGDDYTPGQGYSLPNRVQDFLRRYSTPGIA